MRSILRLVALAGAVLSAACSDGTGPATSSGPSQFSRDITFPQFHDLLSSTARVEIELQPGGPPFVAHEVRVKDAAELADEEEIESRIIAPGFADPQPTNASCRGTVTLALPGVQVRFDAATTEFKAETAEITCAEFLARVRAALAAGREPGIEAERAPATTPQAPDNAVFDAAELELDEEADRGKIELNVTAANLATNDPAACAPPLAMGIKVLGLCITIEPDVTELQAELPEAAGEADFEGLVQSVHCDDDACLTGTFTLASGTVVTVDARTEVKDESGDDGRLGSLRELAAALAAAQAVEADGEGVPGATPGALTAVEMRFEVVEAVDR